MILAGCPTVLIGGASGAASPGAAAAAASAHGATASPGTPGLGAVARPLSPWVGVGYQDAAGRPVAGWRYRAEGERRRDGQVGSGGQVWLDALAGSGAVDVGLVGVYGCRWARDEARVGEAVGMGARCVGVADGAPATFEVWRETASATGAASRAKVWEVAGTVRGGRVEAGAPFVFAWGGAETVASDDWQGTAPVYTCEVSVGGVHRARGGRLRFQDWVEFRHVRRDRSGNEQPVSRSQYRFTTADGSVREGSTDSGGKARVDGVPPGPYDIAFSTPSR